MIRRSFWLVAALSSLTLTVGALWQIVGPTFRSPDPGELPTVVHIGNTAGYVSRTGAMKLPPTFNYCGVDRAGEFEPDGLAPVYRNEHWDWINTKGEVVCSFVCADVWAFDLGGVARVRDGNFKCGWINRRGEVVIPLQWDEANDFDLNGMAKVRCEDKYGWIDRRGAVVIPLQFTSAGDFDEQGLVHVKRDDKWGYIDRSGRMKIAFEWDSAEEFDSRGWAAVQKSDKWGWIDTSGRVVSDLKWDWISFGFDRRGHAAVRLDQEESIIDRSGRLVATPDFDRVHAPDHLGWSAFERNGRHGWFDDKWNEAIPAVWSGLNRDFDENGWAMVPVGGLQGVINRKGEMQYVSDWSIVDATPGGYRFKWNRHPLMKIPLVKEIVEKIGLQNSPPFDSLTVLYDKNLNAYWRSDLYALRPLLWPMAVGGLLVGAFSIWRLRRLSKTVEQAAKARAPS